MKHRKISYKKVVNLILKNKDYFINNLDCIISIGRGGMVPSRLISEVLNIRNVYVLNVKAYTDDDKFDKVKIIDSIPKKLISGKNILIVDDVECTGNTIIEVNKYLRNKGAHLCQSFVLFKNINNPVTGVMCGKYYDGNNEWLDFPWEGLK